jgi:hypothetical protein
LSAIIFGKLNLEFQDLQNVLSAEAVTFTEMIEKAEDLIASEEDKGVETMERITSKANSRTGFLFCPRCGLRKPKNEIRGYHGGHCPVCGCRMVEEGPLPYTSKKSTHIRQHYFDLNQRGILDERSSYLG